MKNLIFLVLILLIISCNSKKVVLKSDVQQKVEQETTVRDTEATQIKADLSKVDQSSNDVETVTETTKYDTSKPTDPATGKPPIIEESKTTENKKGKREVTTTAGTTENKESSHNEATKLKADSDVQVKTIEKTKPFDLKLYIYVFIFLIAGFLVFRYYAKIKMWFS